MDEQNKDLLQEEQEPVAQDATVADEAPVPEKKPKNLKELIVYIKTHENLRQAVLFFLFSMICGASQMLVTVLFTQLYRVGGTLAQEFPGFSIGKVPLFRYETTAEFIGFLLGSIVGQVLTFVLNRKKTFNVRDHIAFRAVAYTIMAAAIIFVQTLLGGAVTVACREAYHGSSDFVKDVVFNLVGLAVGGIAALIISFLGNKFFVMRKFGKKEADAQVEAPQAGQAEEETVPDGEESVQ